jgi:hypothetical protein
MKLGLKIFGTSFAALALGAFLFGCSSAPPADAEPEATGASSEALFRIPDCPDGTVRHCWVEQSVVVKCKCDSVSGNGGGGSGGNPGDNSGTGGDTGGTAGSGGQGGTAGSAGGQGGSAGSAGGQGGAAGSAGGQGGTAGSAGGSGGGPIT